MTRKWKPEIVTWGLDLTRSGYFHTCFLRSINAALLMEIDVNSSRETIVDLLLERYPELKDDNMSLEIITSQLTQFLEEIEIFKSLAAKYKLPNGEINEFNITTFLNEFWNYEF